MSNQHILTIQNADVEFGLDHIIMTWSYDGINAAASAVFCAVTGERLSQIGCTSYPVETGKMIPNPFIERVRSRLGDDAAQRWVAKGKPEMVPEKVSKQAPEWVWPESIKSILKPQLPSV